MKTDRDARALIRYALVGLSLTLVLLWTLYLPSALLMYLSLSSQLAFFSRPWGVRFFIISESLLNRLVPAFLAVMSLLAFAAFVKSHQRAKSVTVKKQTKWIVWGDGQIRPA